MVKLLRRIVFWLTVAAVIILVALAGPKIWGILHQKPDALAAERFSTSQKWSGQLVGADQLVFVMTAQGQTNSAVVTAYSREPDGPWKVAKGPYRARIGTNGFAELSARTEGSDTTPIGVFDITGAFGGGPAPSGTRLPYDIIGAQYDDCWISDPADPAYNRWVLRDPCEAPNLKLSERVATTLKSAIIFDFNATGRVPRQGSALFVHSAVTEGGDIKTTYGGVAMHDGDVRALIKWLDPKANPRLVMGPEAEFPLPPSLAGGGT